MSAAENYTKALDLKPHPEGGYYRETYRSAGIFQGSGGFPEGRNYSTAIYYLLQQNDISHFHRIRSDEAWFFHDGDGLRIHLLEKDQYKKVTLGLNLNIGEQPQFVVGHGAWFAAELVNKQGFGLVSCTVSPGFDFSDFEMMTRQQFESSFVQYSNLEHLVNE